MNKLINVKTLKRDYKICLMFCAVKVDLKESFVLDLNNVTKNDGGEGCHSVGPSAQISKILK